MVLARRYVTALAPVSRPVGPLFSVELWPLSDNLHYGLALTTSGESPHRPAQSILFRLSNLEGG